MNVQFCKVFFVQADATLVDSEGREVPVHGGILKHFPVFRGMKLKKNQVIILDGMSSSEVSLMMGLAYGKGRWDFSKQNLILDMK